MALRKLQAEIDRTLKAVTTGVEVFEATFDKLNHASNATQKDKLETDLKTQIKKLQRMRDQIKVWLGSSDIKDKSSLLENRRLIETQMERFKALEKEMKMKAFSKEGLIAAARLDPAEKAKRDMVDWIGNTTDELSRQIEATEAEAEQLQITGKKKKASGDKLTELELLNERRQWHIGRLEIVQRMFENGQLQLEDVESIQEDVKYFVEANTEEDFDFDNGIYDELNLQDVEEDYNADYGHAAEDSSNVDSASVTDYTEAKTPIKEERKAKASTPADDTPPSPVSVRRAPVKKPTIELKAEQLPPVTSPNLPAKTKSTEQSVPPPTAAAATIAPVTPAKAAPLPPIRYAAAAAAAVGAAHPTTPSADLTASPQQSKDIGMPDEQEDDDSSELISAAPVLMSEPSPVPEFAQSNGHVSIPPPGIAASPSPVPETAPPPGLNGGINSAHQQQQQQPPHFAHAESSRAASNYSQQAQLAQQVQQMQQSQQSPRKDQGVLGNLMQSFDLAKELAERRANDLGELHAALDVSYQNAPAQLDAEPPRYYHPTKPFATPEYYPQTRPPIFEDKSIYGRFELDQLMYIFYYMTGTYEQWLAAQELKRQSWRFHKQYLTWFQRAHNPQAITEDYEQGGYYYFDWENSWCQRKKSDFRFEYRWLSDH